MRNTALHVAVLNGNVAIVKLLVEADPSDRHIQNYEGKNPIYIAAEKGYMAIIKEICTTCTAQCLEGPGGGASALHALIKNMQATEEWKDAVGMIIDAFKHWNSEEDALFNSTDEFGNTVLQLAVERNNVGVVKLLLEEDPAYQNCRGSKKHGLMRLIYKAIDNEYRFTMPGGLHQSGEVDEGLVILSKKTAFNAFMVSDALALLLSTCSLFLYFLESMYEDPHQVSKLNAASTGLNIVSVMAMMLTFITGTYVVLSHSPAIAITVCLIGSFFFLFIIVLLIKMIYDRHVKRNAD
nr:PREDICTED: uncharacterized protein LOC108207155 [Daucus carota subsp. sativus]